MLSGKLNIYHDTYKNQQIRAMAWITNTTEDDPQILEEMFWPNPEELKRHNRMNKEAKIWMKKFRLAEAIERKK